MYYDLSVKDYWSMSTPELEELATEFGIGGYGDQYGNVDRAIIIKQLLRRDETLGEDSDTDEHPTTSGGMSQLMANRILQDQLTAAADLLSEPFSSPKREEWSETTEAALRRIFGQGHSIIKSFGRAQSIIFKSGDTQDNLRKAANDTLASEEAVLRSAIVQLRWNEPTAKKAAQTTMTTSSTSATTPSSSSLPTATVIRILIASPSDVTKERDVVTECIYAWNAAHFGTTGIMLQPVRWETHTYPASGDRPQALINRQIVEDGDCLIGIFGARLGTPTGEALSGTIEEIEIFRKADKHVSLYFSTANVPRNADREQLAALEHYQRERQKDTLYAEFSDTDDLRRLVTQHLHGIVHAVTQASARGAQNPSQPAKNELARLFLRTRPGSQSGDVKTVQVSAMLENISDRRKITDYVCTLSVPRACLTHTSSAYIGEIRKEDEPNRRFFRVSSHDPGRASIIFQGDKVPLFLLDIAVDQLLMKNTYLAGDYEGTLADKVVAEAVVEGELLRAERTVADIFENPNQG
jgi:hypothetical protein